MEGKYQQAQLAYIFGNGRSGTTLFTGLLDYCDDYIGVGELNRGFNNLQNECSCGKIVNQCDFWSRVLKKMEAETGLKQKQFFKSVTDLERKRFFILWVLGFRRSKFETYKKLNQSLVKSITDISGGKIPVDSAKNIMRLTLLRSFLKDISIFHIIRNPRAVLYSNKKVYVRRNYQKKRSLLRYKYIYLAYVLLSWNITNFFGVFFKGKKGYSFTKYEHLADHPSEELEILNIHILLPDSTSLAPEEFHVIYGNRMLKQFKLSAVKPDEEWKTKTRWYHNLAVHILTFPTIWLYGYGFSK